jgi:hypothetical protein
MKKRGERRTGVRWFGLLGEALLFVVLVSVGVLGLTLLSVGALPQPWPWLIAVIPASLVVYGVLGLAEVIWQSTMSTELRSAVAQKASDLESLWAARAMPSVPAIDHVVDSPGVHLKYRLPIDTSPNLLLFGMTLTAIGCNLLVAMFVYQVVVLHRRGEPNWMLTWLMVPLVLAGVMTLVALAREIWMSTAIGATRVEIAEHPLRPGRSCRVYVSQTGRVNVRWLKILLVCQERATYSHGTDTRTEIALVHRQLLHRARKFCIQADQAAVLVRGKVARWPIFERRFPVYVYPTQTTDVSRHVEPLPAMQDRMR